MSDKKMEDKGGLCCPHCADSKFPCVNMERQMRRESKGGEKAEKGRDS